MNESTLVPREEMSDLDWLARNVHVWPTNTPKAIPSGDATFKLGAVFYGDCVAFSGELGHEYRRVNKADWLARRAELQDKPNWGDAPEWAEWLTQDKDGVWLWCGDEPITGERGWNHRAALITQGGIGEAIGDWRDTLEKRPEQAKFEPFVSVEDAQQELSELEMLAKVSHLISDKRHRITPSKYTKTIRGVSVDVYDVLQAWGVSNPALQHLIKKALQCGQRGHKDNAQDLQDIIDSAIRAKELEC